MTNKIDIEIREHLKGYVLSVENDVFRVRVTTVVNKSYPASIGVEEEAEIPFLYISAEDKKKIVPGTKFDWFITLCTLENGFKLIQSMFHFVENQVWTQEEIVKARALAAQYAELFCQKGAKHATAN